MDPKGQIGPNFSRADLEHAGPFWTERVKTVLDGTNSAHLISESATLKATLALPLNLALPIAKLKFRFGPNKVYSERQPFAVKRGTRRPWCSVEVTMQGLIRELKMETFSGRRRPDWQRKPGSEAAVASRQKSTIRSQLTQKDGAVN